MDIGLKGCINGLAFALQKYKNGNTSRNTSRLRGPFTPTPDKVTV